MSNSPYDYRRLIEQARAEGREPDAIAWRRAEWTERRAKIAAEVEERAWWREHHEATEDQNPKAAQAAADDKLPLHLIDTALTHPTARVLVGGTIKYGVRNWRKVPINASTYIGALRRHTDEWADGADADKDSGEHPLAHIAATCNVVLDAIKHGTLVDDRGYADAKTAREQEHYIAGDGSEMPWVAIRSEDTEA